MVISSTTTAVLVDRIAQDAALQQTRCTYLWAVNVYMEILLFLVRHVEWFPGSFRNLTAQKRKLNAARFARKRLRSHNVACAKDSTTTSGILDELTSIHL